MDNFEQKNKTRLENKLSPYEEIDVDSPCSCNYHCDEQEETAEEGVPENKIPMVHHPHKVISYALPKTMYIECEGGYNFTCYKDLQEFTAELDDEDDITVILGIYEFKKFIKVEQVKEVRITEEEGIGD